MPPRQEIKSPAWDRIDSRSQNIELYYLKGWLLIKFSDYDMISPTTLKVTPRLPKPSILINSQRPEVISRSPGCKGSKMYDIQLNRTVKQKCLLLVTF